MIGLFAIVASSALIFSIALETLYLSRTFLENDLFLTSSRSQLPSGSDEDPFFELDIFISHALDLLQTVLSLSTQMPPLHPMNLEAVVLQLLHCVARSVCERPCTRG